MLSREHLTKLMNEFLQDINLEKCHEFEPYLLKKIKETLSLSQWSLEHFLAIAVPLQTQCTLIDRLKEKRVVPSDYTPYIVSNETEPQSCGLYLLTEIPSSNNIPSVKNSIYVLVQDTNDSLPSGLYFIDKRFNETYISQLTFLKNKGMNLFVEMFYQDVKAESFYNIGDLSIDQLNKVTLLTGHTLIEKGRIYFQKKNQEIKYFVKQPAGEVVSDVITKQDIGNESKESFTDKDITYNFSEIMHITFRRGHAHLNIHNSGSYSFHHSRQNKPGDIDQVVKELLNDYDNILSEFRLRKNIIESNCAMSPMEWLEQCYGTDYTIKKYDANALPIGNEYSFHAPKIMETMILAHHFKLDIEKVLAEEDIKEASRCKIEKASEILSVDRENVVSECQKRGIGIYLKKGNFKIERSASIPIKIEYINSNRKITYDYCHKGLVRLLDGTLDHFYENDLISCRNNESYRMIWLQPSLSQLVHGITASCILLRPSESINLNECIFIEEELRNCDAVTIQDSSQDISRDIWLKVAEQLHHISDKMQRGNRIDSSVQAIRLILDAVKKVRKEFDPFKMPGSVQDFFDFCKSLPKGERIFSFSKTTFRKYCTGITGIKSTPIALCKWGEKAKPDGGYWENLMPNIRSYTVTKLVC